MDPAKDRFIEVGDSICGEKHNPIHHISKGLEPDVVPLLLSH